MISIGTIVVIAVLIYSIVLHEIAHGYVADYFGDHTARWGGRLSLNPIVHIDPIGTIIVPLLLYFTSGNIFGWAKPVPVEPYNFRYEWRKNGNVFVALAGPATNFLIAIIAGIVFRLLTPHNETIISIFLQIIEMNVFIAIFNLIPFPPMDGSKVIAPFLPYQIREFVERASIIWVIVFFIALWPLLAPGIRSIAYAITGFIIGV